MDDYLPLIEFTYNNSFHSSIDMKLFKALYGKRCMSLVGWFEVVEISLIGLDFMVDAMDKVTIIRKRLKGA